MVQMKSQNEIYLILNSGERKYITKIGRIREVDDGVCCRFGVIEGNERRGYREAVGLVTCFENLY